jgi:hypothetical protein
MQVLICLDQLLKTALHDRFLKVFKSFRPECPHKGGAITLGVFQLEKKVL